MNCEIGRRVRLTVDVERFPHFIAPKGATGTIIENSTDKWGWEVIAVKLDEPLKGCEEWDNCLIWDGDEREYFNEQTENIEGGNFRDWVCSKCEHEVMATEKPQPIRWSDGHVCHFVEK